MDHAQSGARTRRGTRSQRAVRRPHDPLHVVRRRRSIALGAIEGAKVLAAIEASAGLELDGAVFDTNALRVDPATGDLIAFDAHHHLLFALHAGAR